MGTALQSTNRFSLPQILVFITAIFFLTCSASAQDDSTLPPIPDINWHAGPTIGALGGEAIIDVPVGFSFTEAEGTRKLLEYMQNVTDGSERGMLIHDSLGWFVVFEYVDAGFVKDDERDNLDADEMFKSLLEGQGQSNQERISRGWDSLILRSWVQAPLYNTVTNNLEWGTLIESQNGSQSVNYFTRFLGRRGYYSVTLVVDPSQYTLVLPDFQAAMSGFNYTEGNRYAEFREGDKIAEYGLTALVVGGAGAMAAKAGVFKWLWKVIVVAVAGAAGFLKKFFTGRSSEAKAPGPPTVWTDVQLLFVIVLALGLVQSVRIVPSDLLILQKRLFRPWRFTRPFFRFGTGRLAIAWLDPFSTLGAAFAVRPMPFAISRDGFLPVSPEEPLVNSANTQRAFPTSELSQIESIDTDIEIGGQRLLTFLHPEQALRTAGDIRQWGTRGPTTTADLITQRWFDDTAFRTDFDQAREVVWFLRYSSFFFVLSMLSFLLVWDRAGFNFAYWILCPVVFFWILSVILLWRAHSALRPAYRGARVFSLFEAVFYPISLIRAADSLTLPTTEGYHPLTAAIALEQPEMIIQSGAVALRRLRYPIKSDANGDLLSESVLAQAREATLKQLESLLIRHNYLAEKIIEQTTIVDSSSIYFCPRCLAGYLNEIGECPDCPGVRVLPNNSRSQ